MSPLTAAAIGGVAGFSIFLGLPVARVRRMPAALQGFLNALALGVLIFLLWDILSHASSPVEGSLAAVRQGRPGSFLALAGIFAGGLGLGLLALVYFNRQLLRRAKGVGGPASPHGLAMAIATGLGFHNLSEGLAIGQSAARNEVSLALVLIIGFGLHNATEGFGIVAPLAVEDARPSWSFLLLLGLVGGGPTFLGTIVGRSFVNETLFVAFLALAAGSILYVVIQLLNVAYKMGHKEMLMWGILGGLVAGFATDFVLTAAGV